MDPITPDEETPSLQTNHKHSDENWRTYPLPSGRKASTRRQTSQRVVEAAVVVFLTLFCVSLWNKATSVKESPLSPAAASPFTLFVDQGQKFLVLPEGLVLENAPKSQDCVTSSSVVACFKLIPEPKTKK